MSLSSRFRYILIICLILIISQAAAQWEIISLTSSSGLASSLVSSIFFEVERETNNANCNMTWKEPNTPKGWNKCTDPMLRWRIAEYNDVSNLSIELVEVDLVASHVPPTINILRSSLALSTANPRLLNCLTSKQGIVCSLPKTVSLTPTTSTFDPSPFKVLYSETRTDGYHSGAIPCTSGFIFWIYDPNVATLGPLTLGRGDQHAWETTCSTSWGCPQNAYDPSIHVWTACAAPSFTFEKTLPFFPTSNGNQFSNFVLHIKHSFPLMMATSIRGNDVPDYSLTDPEEAPGLEVVLTLEPTSFNQTRGFDQVIGDGMDQTPDCGTGCEYSGGVVEIKVFDVELAGM